MKSLYKIALFLDQFPCLAELKNMTGKMQSITEIRWQADSQIQNTPHI